MKINYYPANPEYNEPAKVVFFPRHANSTIDSELIDRDLDRAALWSLAKRIGYLSRDADFNVTHLTIEVK